MSRALAVAVGALALAGVAAPSSARAGSYDVYACGGAAGGAQNAFGASADRGMAAYSICPNTPSDAQTGIVTRASANSGPGIVPFFAGAYQIFEAPPGASLESVSFDLAAIRLAGYWTVGLVAYDDHFDIGALPYGCYAGQPGCGIGSAGFFGPVTIGLGAHSRFRFESRCVNTAGCDISASSFRPATRALFSAANVRVRVRDSTAPSINPASGALWSGGWHRGDEQAWQSLQDNVGIMAQHFAVDGQLQDVQDYKDGHWPDPVRCDFTRRRPCHDVHAGVFFNTRSVSDGRHTITIGAVDAAGNHTAVDHQINVDNTAPARVDPVVAGGEDWRRSNSFDVRWELPPGQVAPITRLHYRLCDAASQCTDGSRTGSTLNELRSLAVPGPGDHTLRVWLEDAAGNAALEAGPPVHLRLDDVPPEAAFELLDEADPRALSVHTSDAGSGLADGVIELRRSGWRSWRELPTSLGGDRLSTYLDDVGLADGPYELRARVRDRAGNERVSDRRSDGSQMQIALPLRSASLLTVATTVRSRRCARPRNSKRACPRSRKRLQTGAATLAGRIATGDGRPLGGVALGVFQRTRSQADFRALVAVRSDPSGRFELNLPPGPSRTVRFSFAGSAVVKPAVRDAHVLVAAASTLATSRRRLRNGQAVVFRGRLAGGDVPEGGKLVDLQAFYRGRWRTFATPRTDRAGRWRFRYRFEATRGLVRYRFRALIRREAAYPYELGRSRAVRVTVRGP